MRKLILPLFALALLAACNNTPELSGDWTVIKVQYDDKDNNVPQFAKNAVQGLKGTKYSFNKNGAFSKKNENEDTKGKWQANDQSIYLKKNEGSQEIWEIEKREGGNMVVRVKATVPGQADMFFTLAPAPKKEKK